MTWARRARVPAVLAGTVTTALLAAWCGLLLTGAAAPSLLFDPGAAVRWGLPLVTVLGDVAAAVTVGVLLLTAVAFPVLPGDPPGRPARAYGPGLLVAAAGSAVWTLTTLVKAVFEYAQLSGTPISDPNFGSQLWAYLRDASPGRGLVWTALLAATITLLAAGGTGVRVAGWGTLLGLAALVPAALAGHAAGSTDHETAVSSLGLHLLGVTVWVGGLLGLVLLGGRLGPALPAAARRYSRLALWAFVLVAASGVINAAIRVPRLAGLSSSYGMLLLFKTAALALLGTAGLLHRNRTLPDLDDGVPGAFRRLAAVEVLIMGLAIGFAGALAASAPPYTGPRPPVTPAEAITGYRLPPPPSPANWLTVWQPDLFWLLVAALAAGLYLAGVRRLRARGDRWPVGRTVSWLLGVVLLVYVTSGPPAAYGRVLFSAHMLGHMITTMLVPLFLVLGAPVTLALRGLPARTDHTRGAREWLLVVLESRFARVLSFPPVAAVLFAGSLVVFYYSPLFGLALRTHLGHELMHVHFLLAGYLFVWMLVGIDPGGIRVTPPLKLITLLASMAFHAFFGVAMLSSATVLEPGYFGALGRTWGAGLLADQHTGGGIAWGIGELPTIMLVLVLAVQWSRSDDREARRRDRAADRDGDAELTAYNAMLARMAQTDRPPPSTGPMGEAVEIGPTVSAPRDSHDG